MNKTEMIKEILSDMEYDENIRNGIWKHQTDTYQEFFHYCHEDMLPDDIRYSMIHNILSSMTEYEDIEEIDSMEMLEKLIPMYTYDITSWLSSSNARYSYCDEYQEEYGNSNSILNLLSGGYLLELEEVYNLIDEWLDDNCEE